MQAIFFLRNYSIRVTLTTFMWNFFPPFYFDKIGLSYLKTAAYISPPSRWASQRFFRTATFRDSQFSVAYKFVWIARPMPSKTRRSTPLSTIASTKAWSWGEKIGKVGANAKFKAVKCVWIRSSFSANPKSWKSLLLNAGNELYRTLL